MSVPYRLPHGYRARASTLDDAPTICALMAAQGQASIGADDVTLDEVVADLSRSRVDLALDSLLVSDLDGELVAWGCAFDEYDERGYVDVYLAPGMPDDAFAAVAAVLLEHAVARLALLAVQRGRTATVAAGIYRGETRLAQALREAGFDHDRVYWRMAVDVDPSRPVPVRLPEGAMVRPLDPNDKADLRVAHGLRNETMSGHHGTVREDLDAFWERWSTMPGFDPAAWWLAEAGGRPAGILLGDDSRVDVGAGFVRTLGVCEWARGRGIAKALLATAFNAYAERGRSTVMLGVDSQNQTGATALYESMGMAPAVVYDSWALTLTPAGEGVPATRSRNASTSV